MAEQQRSKPTIIDEDGVPVVDAGEPSRAGGFPDEAYPGAGAAGFPGAPGMPGAAMPGLLQFPEELLGRNGKPSLVKILGWKGIAVLVAVTAGLIALAVTSLVFALIAVPVLLLLGAIGWVAAKVRGPKNPPSRSTVVVVRR